MYDSHETYMGWLRLVGSLKTQVSFAKQPCKRDNILQKRPTILWSLLIVATPYAYISHILKCVVSEFAHQKKEKGGGSAGASKYITGQAASYI